MMEIIGLYLGRTPEVMLINIYYCTIFICDKVIESSSSD